MQSKGGRHLGFPIVDADGGNDEVDKNYGEAGFLHNVKHPLADLVFWIARGLLDGGTGASCTLAQLVGGHRGVSFWMGSCLFCYATRVFWILAIGGSCFGCAPIWFYFSFMQPKLLDLMDLQGFLILLAF